MWGEAQKGVRNSLSDRNVLYDVCGAGYTIVSICQISSNYKLKILLYINSTSIKLTKIYSCKKFEAFFKMLHWYF